MWGFFGCKRIWVESQRIQVSDLERTVLDCLEQPQYSGGFVEAAKILAEAGARDDMDWGQTTVYLSRLANGALYKRMGWLVEFLELPCPPRIRSAWQQRVTRGYAMLDSSGPRTGKMVARWQVRVNFDLRALAKEVGP